MRIITVEEYSTMPGRYTCEYRDDGKAANRFQDDKTGASAIAAVAMRLANETDNYCIFGPEKVLKCIPENLRAK